MPEPNDRKLLQDVATGNGAALRALYARHSPRVYNTALSYLQNTADAEEVTQDVFAKAWRAAAKFKAESEVTTWLYRITVNTALTALKKRQRRGFLGALSATNDPPDFHHPGAKLEERETNRALFAAIYRLPERQKTAFVDAALERILLKKSENPPLPPKN